MPTPARRSCSMMASPSWTMPPFGVDLIVVDSPIRWDRRKDCSTRVLENCEGAASDGSWCSKRIAVSLSTDLDMLSAMADAASVFSPLRSAAVLPTVY